jgi:acyl carrier protein
MQTLSGSEIKEEMTQAEIIKRMQPAFDEVFMQPVALRATLTADDVEEWDSLSHVPLILAIESIFGITFRVGEVEFTRNVGELADLISRRMSKA